MDQLDAGATIRSFSPNQKVFNRYLLQKILGRGGMGVVWLARDGELDRPVALKFLPEIVALDPASVAELKRETRRNLDLTHPHIVRIYDFVQDARSAAISMEYVDGPSLAALRAERPHGIFSLAELERWMAQLGQGLAYAHERARVVHRDLKPANLMVGAAGDLKITDFGIATSISDSVSRVSGRSTSGTAAYMSPQQMMGDRPGVSDDIYAVGATLYELLTGKPPFHAGNIIAQATSKVPPSIAERRRELGITSAEPVPPAWERAIARCLAKTPQDRPASVGALMDELAGKATPAAATAPPPPEPGSGAIRLPNPIPPGDAPIAPSVASTPFSRRVKPAAVAAIIAVMAIAAAIGGYFLSRDPVSVRSGGTETAADRTGADSTQSSLATTSSRTGSTPDTASQPVSGSNAGSAPAGPEAAPLQPASSQDPSAALKSLRADAPPVVLGSILVTSEPDDAEVTLAGSTRRTPTQFQGVPPGRVTLTFAKDGYEPRSVELELAAGQALQLPPVKLAAVTFPVTVDATTPDVAYALEAGGETLRGALPATLRLPAGRHQIRYSRPGYGEKNEAVLVGSGGAAATADLRGGSIVLESTPGGAEVRLDGRVVGNTPLTLSDLAPGTRQLEFRLADHLTRTVAVEPALGSSSSQTVVLEPDPQTVYLKALHGHWAAGLNGLRFTDTSGHATYRAGANFVKGRNFPMKLLRFDAGSQTGVFQADDPKLPVFEIVLRTGTVFLRWQTGGKGRFYEVPMYSCTEEYFNKL